MKVTFFGHNAGLIRVVRIGDTEDISVSLSKTFTRAADRLAKTAVVFAVLYFAFEIAKAFMSGAVERAVR